MSVYAKVWAYEQHPLQVDAEGKPKEGTRNPAAKAVLVALAEFPGVGQRECWPAQETLAAMTDYDERTVRRHMAVLEDQGYIERTERRKKGQRLTDMVTLLGPPEAFGPAAKPPDTRAGRGKKATGQSVQSHRTECPKPPDRVSGEPVLEPSREPSFSPRGADAPSEPPAKTMTTLTVERTREVGFDAAPHQKANWGKGWSEFCYVSEGKDPPSAERQYAILGEIVSAASGKGGTARYFLAVGDAVKRVEEATRGRGGRHLAAVSGGRPRNSIAVIGATDDDYNVADYR